VLEALQLRPIQSVPGRWLAAAGMVALATVLSGGFQALADSPNLFTLYYPALITTALLCGRRPSYVALVAVVLIVATFELPPLGTPRLLDPAAQWAMAAFVGVSIFMIEVAIAATRYAARLERQRADLKTMLDLLPVGVAIAQDPRADYITMSPTLAAMLRLPVEQNASMSGPEAERIPYQCLRDGREVPADELPMQLACRTGRPVQEAELTLVFPDGHRLDLIISAAPLFDESGGVRGAVASHVDVTKLKAAQQVLDKSSRQKDEFIAMLAHELRNPMAPIMYSAELLRPDAPAAMITQARATIRRQARHIGRLLDDLLDVSRITRNIIELKRKPVSLGHVVETALETARAEIERKGHNVVWQCPAEAAWVEGDPDRLHQIVLNLLTNATKYMEPGGDIRVAIEPRGNAHQLRVTDTGIGLAPEMIPRIFELFTQVHAGVGDGLGIGLSVVRRLVELHGGTVEAKSQGLGKGSEFLVTLPAIEPPMAAKIEEQAEVVRFGAAHVVLVVDDNRDAVDSLAAVLRMHDVSVQVAYDGRQAIAVAQAFKPKAIVLDIGLPGLSGYEVAKWVRSQPWGAAVRLIAVTGWGQAPDRADAIAAGFDHHLVKPVDPEHLLERLQGLYTVDLV
jgi:signal transduction histidine kinase/ActR/RegA family two-component response regulator